MISLIIFKSNARGMQYGIGTYIRELTKALLLHTDMILYLVTYNNSDCKEYSIETISSRYFKINIPSPCSPYPQNNQSEERYASALVNLLSDVIPKDGEVVFQMNYVDDLPIIKKLKERYSHTVISLVHFAQWQQLFNGNQKGLIGLNIDVPSNNIEFTISKEKEMYQLSDHIVSITGYMKDFLTENYGIAPDRVTIVRNGISFYRFRTISLKKKLQIKQILGFNPNERIILFSGRIDPDKGIFFLLEAFEEACKYADNIRLVIMGQGDIQECFKKYHSSYGKITYTGFLPVEKLKAFYDIADICVVLSKYEQCPYTVLEMIAHKIPLILSRINGLNEILNDSQCLFINPIIDKKGELIFNINEIADAILFMVNNEEKAKQMTRDYPELIRTRFSGERMASEMYSVLKSLSKAAIEA